MLKYILLFLFSLPVYGFDCKEKGDYAYLIMEHRQAERSQELLEKIIRHRGLPYYSLVVAAYKFPVGVQERDKKRLAELFAKEVEKQCLDSVI